MVLKWKAQKIWEIKWRKKHEINVQGVFTTLVLLLFLLRVPQHSSHSEKQFYWALPLPAKLNASILRHLRVWGLLPNDFRKKLQCTNFRQNQQKEREKKLSSYQSVTEENGDFHKIHRSASIGKSYRVTQRKWPHLSIQYLCKIIQLKRQIHTWLSIQGFHHFGLILCSNPKKDKLIL